MTEVRGWTPGDDGDCEPRVYAHTVQIPMPQEWREAYDELAYLREHELRDLTPEQREAFDAVEERVSREMMERFFFGSGA